MGDGNTRQETDDELRRRLLKALGVGAAGSFAGYLGERTATQDDGDTLRVGVYGPLTGPTANIGEQKRNGWDLMADLVNENGGIDGAEIELFYADSESEPASGRSAVNRLIQQEDIDVLGGGYHSDVTLSVVEVTNQNDVPQIIDESVSAAIVEKINENDMQNAFKTAPPSQAYAAAWGDLIQDFQEAEVGYFPFEDQRVALIAEDTSYGITVMEETASEFEDAGWEVISQDEVPLDETNFTPVLSRIRAEEPDVVWAVQTSSAGTGAVVQQFRELGFENTHFMHNFGLTIPQARENAGASADGVFTIVHPDKIPQLLSELGWQEPWDETYDAEMSGSAATSLSNIWVIANLVEAVGGVEALRDAGMDEWGQTVIDAEPIKSGIGYVDYEENHQAAWGSADTIPTIGYQVMDGELNFVWPFDLAETEVDESPY